MDLDGKKNRNSALVASTKQGDSDAHSQSEQSMENGLGLSSKLNQDELNEYREIFNLVDRDGGGSISKEELAELMDTLGINASQEEIDLMINEIDQDSNGEVDFDEFVAVMSRSVNAKYTADQVKQAFRVFEDKTHPGHVKVEALKDVLLKYCQRNLTPDQVSELLLQLEVDSDGCFNFVEYVNMMMSSYG